MNKVLTLVCLFISFLGFSQSPGNKYFEGVVEYDVQNHSYMQGVTDNELRDRYGRKLIFYFKNGSYMREYVDELGTVLARFLYIKEDNKYYRLSGPNKEDTVFWTDASVDDSRYEPIIEGKKEKILDCECRSAIIKNVMYIPEISDSIRTTATYFFCPDLPVDPQWQKNMAVWNNIIKEYKSIAVKFIEDDHQFFRRTHTATRISWETIPADKLMLDPKAILKKSE